MMPTLRFGRIDFDSHDASDPRADGGPTDSKPPSAFAEGTPLPRRAIEQIEAANDDDESDELALTTPVPLLDKEEIGTRRIIHHAPGVARATTAERELGTRTLMGVMPRAVRATATQGEVEARPATVRPSGRDLPVRHESRVRISPQEIPAAQIPTIPSVRQIPVEAPLHLDDSDGSPGREERQRRPGREPVQQGAPTAPTAPTAHGVEHWSDWDQLVAPRGAAANRGDQVLAKGYRVLGFGVLGLVVLVLAGYIATTAFYFFSTSWVMPVVVTDSDDKVIAIKQELVTQQTHRERLAGELGEIDQTIAALETKHDTSAKPELEKAHTSRKSAQAALARQDEIVRGLQQSSYLRAAKPAAPGLPGPSVAMVPYENLKGVTPGTKVYGCSYKMLWCRQVGSVVEVLPGEVTFKHPKRDATMRGQMIQLQLMMPEAAASTMLFLDGAPLLL